MKKEKKRCRKKATTKRIQWRIWGAYWVLMVCCSHSHWLQYHGSSDSLALSLSLRCLVWRLLFFYSLHDVIFLFFLVVVVVVGFFISFAAGFYVVRMLLWFYGKYCCVCVCVVRCAKPLQCIRGSLERLSIGLNSKILIKIKNYFMLYIY